MADVKTTGQTEREALREKLLQPRSTDDTGVYQLEFSSHWYRAIYYGGTDNPWIKAAAAIEQISERQKRTDNAPVQQIATQIGLFDEGEC